MSYALLNLNKPEYNCCLKIDSSPSTRFTALNVASPKLQRGEQAQDQNDKSCMVYSYDGVEEDRQGGDLSTDDKKGNDDESKYDRDNPDLA